MTTDMRTGEIVEFDRAAAERRAERITLRLDAIADNYRAVLPMIREAIEKRDDLALGYRSPGEYVSDRFGQSLAGLGIEVRRAVVGELTEAGLSTRAIAKVVKVHHATVASDFHAGVGNPTPDPTPQGEGDSASGADDPAQTEATSGVNRPQDYPEAPAPAPRPAVTGIDGKTYTRPAVPQRRHRDDAETYLNAVEMYARKAAREADKLTGTQIARVRGEADLWTAGLRESVEALQRLLTSLTKEK